MIIQKTRDEVLKEMLDRLPEEYDTTEGGLFYDNLAPAAISFEEFGEMLAYIFKNSFAASAGGIFLDYIASEAGVFRKKATTSKGQVTIIGQAGIKVEIGTQVSSDSYIYVITEEGQIGESEEITLTIESQKSGEIYNVPAGAIDSFPVTIPGLKEVTNKEATTGGYNEETDKELLERYTFKVQNPITSGNIYHYKKWCLEVPGVGGAKIDDLWRGPGTVKCVIANEDYSVAPEELLKRVREHIEAVRPIGADVTIESAKNKNITITATVKTDKNFTIEDIQAAYTLEINKYLRDISFEGAEVSYARVGSILLNTPGVIDYKFLFLNSGLLNVNLSREEVPGLKKIELTAGN